MNLRKLAVTVTLRKAKNRIVNRKKYAYLKYYLVVLNFATALKKNRGTSPSYIYTN